MRAHTTATTAEVQAAREKLRERENELARLSGEIARERRELPWVRIGKQVPGCRACVPGGRAG